MYPTSSSTTTGATHRDRKRVVVDATVPVAEWHCSAGACADVISCHDTPAPRLLDTLLS